MLNRVVIKSFVAFCIFFPLLSFAQIRDSASGDTLEIIIISAYEHRRELKDIPAAVNYVSSSAMNRYSPSSVLMAINSTPGIRMEERSPGSYRMNIRGSALRSPFGVRNVKIYYNDLPVTDPGGNTFFNQFAPVNFNSIEIIKGPGSSVYGSGTGGVLLIDPLPNHKRSIALAEFAAGSYNMQQFTGEISTRGEYYQSHAAVQYQKAHGYREHSQMERKVFSCNGRFQFKKNALNASFLLGDHFYETPGALNYDEYIIDPSKSRPGTAFSPGAIQNNASIRQTGFLAGISWAQHLSNKFQNKTSLYGMYTQLDNPAIRNYGKTSEPHTGFRSVFYYDDSISNAALNLVAGGEWQVGFPGFETFKNKNGSPDSLLWFDEVRNRQNFVFSQLRLSIHSWTMMAGASLNLYKTRIQRFSPSPSQVFEKKFINQVAPRISVSHHFGRHLFYAGLSRGFSPPSVAELNPTGSAINAALEPELGNNYDLGFRTDFGWLNIDINTFHFELENTIVLRRDSAGGDYYINSGRTKQRGIESGFVVPVFSHIMNIASSQFWLSHTWHYFRYRNFIQLENDYSGNKIPGIAPHTIAAGFDLKLINGFSTYLHYFFSDRIPLNDANTTFSPAYHLVGIKLGYKKEVFKNTFRLQAGVENLMNEKYSLGNDINGFGGRYYNAAAGRNYYASLRWQFNMK